MKKPKTLLWQLVIPVLWIGMVFAISFIEAPLKFQAPGITIPLGLGIGRLVFTALNIAEVVLALVLMVVSVRPRTFRLPRGLMRLMLTAVGVLALKIVTRIPLNARTNLVLEGADPGQSPWHYVYIALDVALLLLLTLFATKQAKRISEALK